MFGLACCVIQEVPGATPSAEMRKLYPSNERAKMHTRLILKSDVHSVDGKNTWTFGSGAQVGVPVWDYAQIPADWQTSTKYMQISFNLPNFQKEGEKDGRSNARISKELTYTFLHEMMHACIPQAATLLGKAFDLIIDDAFVDEALNEPFAMAVASKLGILSWRPTYMATISEQELQKPRGADAKKMQTGETYTVTTPTVQPNTVVTAYPPGKGVTRAYEASVRFFAQMLTHKVVTLEEMKAAKFTMPSHDTTSPTKIMTTIATKIRSAINEPWFGKKTDWGFNLKPINYAVRPTCYPRFNGGTALKFYNGQDQYNTKTLKKLFYPDYSEHSVYTELIAASLLDAADVVCVADSPCLPEPAATFFKTGTRQIQALRAQKDDVCHKEERIWEGVHSVSEMIQTNAQETESDEWSEDVTHV